MLFYKHLNPPGLLKKNFIQIRSGIWDYFLKNKNIELGTLLIYNKRMGLKPLLSLHFFNPFTEQAV